MIDTRDLPLLAIFVAVVRGGSFTTAGRELGLGKSGVSERVRTLEERLGLRLLERSTRRLRLTQAGEEVLAVATQVVHAAGEVNRIVEMHREGPVGTLRVTSTQDLGVRLVAPAVAALGRRHPGLRMELIFDDAMHDLVAEGFDVAVRLGPTADSKLVMRRLGSEPEVVVASLSQAEAFGRASRPAQLSGAAWVIHSGVPLPPVWRFRDEHGEEDELTVMVRATTNSSEGMRALVLGGVGLGVMPRYLVAEELLAGRLVQLCPGWIRRTLTLSAVMPDRRHPPKRVSLFLEALRERVAAAGLGPG